MPSSTIRVWKVTSQQTNHPQVTQYLIDGTVVEGPSRHFQGETIQPWIASLAQRAHDTEQALRVEWTTTKWGPEIQAVELVAMEAV